MFACQLKPDHKYIHLMWGVCKYIELEKVYSRIYCIFEFKKHSQVCEPIEDVKKDIRECPMINGEYPELDTFDIKAYRKGKRTKWQKNMAKAQSKVHNEAVDLMKIAAERKRVKGFKFYEDNELQKRFESMCPYPLTQGQQESLNEIKRDMESNKVMNRVLIGDVGMGKTEVAIRAVFKAVQSHKQAIVLAPTGVLAKQHYGDFTNRYKDFNINVAFLSSATKPKEKREIIKNIQDGVAQVIIGTSSVVSKSIQYKNLGLIVIDEEQRFGVVTKEKIKNMQIDIDSLSMSATPIPRTTEQTIAGIADVSKITTAPVAKKPIVTDIFESVQITEIKNAITREMYRNGQIYFIENDIERLSVFKEELLKLIPSLKIGIINGKMKNKEITSVMHNFADKKYDLLLATTIIEVGINVKNANTIIINNANCFGLAQLQQLRGRVGRSDRQGYCYLIYDTNRITSTGIRRLKILKDNNRLGAGELIAKEDLDMRGMGDLAGIKQHGKGCGIPAGIYMELLQKEIKKLKFYNK